MTAQHNTLVVPARAKINVFLHVLGRRPDGYHDLESLVVPISLADRLDIHAFADPQEFRTLSLSLDVVGDPSLVRGVPRDESNLALRAALALSERTGIRGFADILLEKRVPAGAGLGGGSADAAATLRALNELWSLHLGEDELREVAASVGSDVPALLADQPVVMRGRGELVEAASVPPLAWALVTFRFAVSTADAYRWWDEEEASGDRRAPIDPRRQLDALKGLRSRRPDVRLVATLLSNDLEAPVARRHPEITEARDLLLRGGAAGAVMSGSGPSVAGLLPTDRAGLEPRMEEELVELSGLPLAYVGSAGHRGRAG